MTVYMVSVGIPINATKAEAERIAQSIQDELGKQLADRQAKDKDGSIGWWDVQPIEKPKT